MIEEKVHTDGLTEDTGLYCGCWIYATCYARLMLASLIMGKVCAM